MATTAVVGCAQAVPQAEPGRRPAAFATSRLPAPGSRCAQRGLVLRKGERVPAPYLAAVQFLSPAIGVGVTASEVNCTFGVGGVGSEDLTPWLVGSADGGRTWRAMGAELPRWLAPRFSEARLAFSAPGVGWLAASGALAFTSDRGQSWRRVNPGGYVTELVAAGTHVAALVTRPDGAPLVWRLGPARVRHRRLPLIPGALPLAAQTLAVQYMTITAPSGWLVLDVPGTSGGGLFGIDPAGRRWLRLTDPCHRTRSINDPMSGFEALAAIPGGGLAAVCGHGVGMMHATQSFLVSRDGGRTWLLRSAEVAGGPDLSGLPFGGPTAVACPGGSACVFATAGEVTASTDGGARWRSVVLPSVPGDGAFGTVVSFVGGQRGWLLLQGEGLLRTTNGSRWVALGKFSV